MSIREGVMTNTKRFGRLVVYTVITAVSLFIGEALLIRKTA